MSHHWNAKKDIIWGLVLMGVVYALYWLYKNEYLPYEAQQQANQQQAASDQATQDANNQQQLLSELSSMNSNSGSAGATIAALTAGGGSITPVSQTTQTSGFSNETLAQMIASLESVTGPVPGGGNSSIPIVSPVVISTPQQPVNQPATHVATGPPTSTSAPVNQNPTTVAPGHSVATGSGPIIHNTGGNPVLSRPGASPVRRAGGATAL